MSQSSPNVRGRCLFYDWAEHRPNQLAFIHDQSRYCWKDVKQIVAYFVLHLQAQGVDRGDTLAILGKTHEHHIWLFLASMVLDIRISFIAPDPDLVVTQKLDRLVVNNQQIWIYCLTDNLISGYAYVQNVGPVTELDLNLYLPKRQSDPHHYSSSNLATLTFTSGSMGVPKVVAHSHQQHLASASGLLKHFSFTQDDCWLLSLPLYHVSGLSILYRWLYAGACMKVGNHDLEHDIADVSHASLVPVQLARLLEKSSQSLTHVLLGGSHIPSSLCQQAEECGIETWLGYGMTEAASTVTAKRSNGQDGVGWVLPHRRLIIRDQRILGGGETLALGYYHCGQITSLVDSEGWFDSKDLGEWNEGELMVLGRADNMFISGGENIHCEEIEAALTSIASINSAIVLPVVDAEYGARPIALIDHTDFPVSRDDIEIALASRLAKYKWPIDYFSLPKLSKTQGIKTPRRDVVEWFNDQETQYLVMS